MSLDVRLLTALFFVAGALSACVHATPVTPAPLSVPEAVNLQAAIVGTCEVTATQKEGGNVKSDSSGLKFAFKPDGSTFFETPGPFGGVIHLDHKYKLEGRNIITDGPYKLRADDFGGPVLKLFNYDESVTYFCTKRT
jgi:hypothetical protein